MICVTQFRFFSSPVFCISVEERLLAFSCTSVCLSSDMVWTDSHCKDICEIEYIYIILYFYLPHRSDFGQNGTKLTNNLTWITTYISDNISQWPVFLSEAESVFSVVKTEAKEKSADLNIITKIVQDTGHLAVCDIGLLVITGGNSVDDMSVYCVQCWGHTKNIRIFSVIFKMVTLLNIGETNNSCNSPGVSRTAHIS